MGLTDLWGTLVDCICRPPRCAVSEMVNLAPSSELQRVCSAVHERPCLDDRLHALRVQGHLHSGGPGWGRAEHVLGRYVPWTEARRRHRKRAPAARLPSHNCSMGFAWQFCMPPNECRQTRRDRSCNAATTFPLAQRAEMDSYHA